MIRTKILRDPDGQVVRLPADVAFPAGIEDVFVVADGPLRIVGPAQTSWDDFFEQPGMAIDRGPQPEFRSPQRRRGLRPEADRLASGRRS